MLPGWATNLDVVHKDARAGVRPIEERSDSTIVRT